MNEINPTQPSDFTEFSELYAIIKRLRDPLTGCPWDLKQTATTLRKNLLEEVYECIDAIDQNDNENLQEELGDLTMLVLMLCRIKEQESVFRTTDVFQGICAKLIRRHPHIFGDDTTRDIPGIIKNWDYIKENIEGKKAKDSLLENIPAALPPLEKAAVVQKKAAKVGFEWETVAPVFEKLTEEIAELQAEIAQGDQTKVEAELGDVLFTVVNIARMLKIDSALALNRTNNKFISRFQTIERVLKERNIDINTAGVKLMDEIWDDVKTQEHTSQ